MGAAMRAFESNVLQVQSELEELGRVLRDNGALSLLEIGAKYGGSIWKLSQYMDPGSRLVVVDMPRGTKEWSFSEPSLKQCMRELQQKGYETHIIWGDSTTKDVIEKARALGPYDAVFIDANHTLPYVTKDWETYGPMAKIVAFHDIHWWRAPEWVGTRIDVPQFWNKIKEGFRHEEFRLCPTGKNNGIGVLWR